MGERDRRHIRSRLHGRRRPSPPRRLRPPLKTRSLRRDQLKAFGAGLVFRLQIIPPGHIRREDQDHQIIALPDDRYTGPPDRLRSKSHTGTKGARSALADDRRGKQFRKARALYRSRLRSPIPLGAVEYAGNDELIPLRHQFIDDDVRQSADHPFIGAPHAADMTDVRKSAEAFGRRQDPLDDRVGDRRSILGDPGVNFVEVIRRRIVEDDPHALERENRVFTSVRF